MQTALWLADLGDSLHEKLVGQALVKPRPKMVLKEWLNQFVASKTKLVKNNTPLAMERSQAIIEERCGTLSIKSITAEQCQEFREWLAEQYAQPTVAKIVKHNNQFFNAAVKAKLISANPLDAVKAGSQVNEERSVYVSVQTIEKAIQHAPDAQWRLLIA